MLCYCCNIVGCTSKTNQKKILLIQKKAVRIVTKSKYNDHTAPLFSKLNMLTYENMLQFSKLSFMHSIEFKYAPPSFFGLTKIFSDLFLMYNQQYYNSRGGLR